MRQAALEASTYDDASQKAVEFHEQRVEEIVDGDHELDDRDPQLVAHVIPEGFPNSDTLSAERTIDQTPPSFIRESANGRRHKYGEIVGPAHRNTDQLSYSLHMFAGGLEVVSGREISEAEGDMKFFASRTEAKLTAVVNWAQEAFQEEYDSESLTVLTTLVGVEGEEIRVSDRAAPRTRVSHPVFKSDRINPWPVKVPVESVGGDQTYESLMPFFDRLWTDSDLPSSIFYTNGTEALKNIRDFRR